MNNDKVSIIIPTYNEAENIGNLIRNIESELSNHVNDYEIVVVDDNSPDKTYEIVDKISKNDNHVKLILRKEKKGLSSAIFDGIKKSSGNIIVVMDADYQHPPEKIPKLIESLKNYDVAVASRYTKGGKTEGFSFYRKIVSKGATLLAKILVPEVNKTSDPMSGFFAFRKDSVNLNKLNVIGYKILFEILYKNPNLKVIDVPYTFKKRSKGKSKLGIKEIFEFLIHVIINSRVIKFGIIGALGTIVNLGIMYLLISKGLFYDYASAIAIETSILFNFTLNDKWTFKDKKGRPLLSRILRYNLIVGPSGVTIFFVMELLTKLLKIYPLMGQFIGIIFGFVVNFLLSYSKVWNV
ncbi:putative membrane protein [Caldisphaera lagunensis DSM 15908]|uniref:Dolichol-phosphate mannosyltransferase n=1 Tax=Caldisphaera lagunensis (strain DSM 15908 / JCM 11604 / ANMR 0165 / IC-154) TaxID=1056495 RepID=L0A8G7_CALLD|nr:glycosyltransferase family 2 protein [Caldisphaera lagunensis]AFZ70153.1 putative membrane protein [Caldisphaera lagunensis DSM 15908]